MMVKPASSNWDQLKKLCLECDLPEPEIRRKLWVTVVAIPNVCAKCNNNEEDAIEAVIKWCQGYLEGQNAK